MNNRGNTVKIKKGIEFRGQWDDNKSSNLHAIGVPEKEEKDDGTEKDFREIMAENFPNLAKDINLHEKKAEMTHTVHQNRITEKKILKQILKAEKNDAHL